MTLFLTSDEQIYGNTRTSFDNCIQQDFFSEQGRNVALKEIFFDAKFPTLINNSSKTDGSSQEFWATSSDRS